MMKDTPSNSSKKVRFSSGTRRPENARRLTESQNEYLKEKSNRENIMTDFCENQSEAPSLGSQGLNTTGCNSRVLIKNNDPSTFEKEKVLKPDNSQETFRPGAVRVSGLGRENHHIAHNNNSDDRTEDAPIVNADLVNEQEGQRQDWEVSSSYASASDLPVIAQAMKEESTETSHCSSLRDQRLFAILSILLIAIVGFAAGITLVLIKADAETETVSNTALDPATSNSTALSIITSPPTVQPTKGFDFVRPSQAQCHQIVTGKVVPGQEQLILKTYYVELDVVMHPSVTDMANHLDTLVNQMQARIAPVLVQCESLNARQLRGNPGYRNLQRSDYLVGNVKFLNATLPTNRSCKTGSPEPCYKVIETVNLYIKVEELDVRLIGRIMDAFNGESLVQVLDLQFPFEAIEAIGAASNVDLAFPSVNVTDSIDEDGNED